MVSNAFSGSSNNASDPKVIIDFAFRRGWILIHITFYLPVEFSCILSFPKQVYVIFRLVLQKVHLSLHLSTRFFLFKLALTDRYLSSETEMEV